MVMNGEFGKRRLLFVTRMPVYCNRDEDGVTFLSKSIDFSCMTFSHPLHEC
jgi:hypothetical protein